MSAPVETLDGRRVRDLLAGERFVSHLVLLDQTASTNDEALRLAAQGAREGTVVIADAQSAGRGRLGRPWHSAAGAGLYLSVLLRPATPIEEWTRWTVASALAICEACRAVTGCDVVIEWPNDLLIAGRKVAGILCEARSGPAPAHALVVGVGINVNHLAADFPPELRERASSLRMACGGRPVDRECLAARALRELDQVSTALARGEWSRVRDSWTLRAPGARNRRVRVLQDRTAGPGAGFEGRTRGLDAAGALLVERESGDLVAVHAAGSVDFLEA